MCARTLCPFVSSTRNIAFGRASTTEPSISMTPSFLAIASLSLGVWDAGRAMMLRGNAVVALSGMPKQACRTPRVNYRRFRGVLPIRLRMPHREVVGSEHALPIGDHVDERGVQRMPRGE